MRKLERATGNLDLALRSITQALALFDAEHGLLLINERFLDIFGLPEGAFRQPLSACDIDDIIGDRIVAFAHVMTSEDGAGSRQAHSHQRSA